ncbi:hypothetical protein LMG29542_02300 [Paraburkholderia humisilvae]|uniref:Uncharacterized protein n=2 Tax=Paraburkholderia humisilvae TaxID=627669 RepID=A0A6J5DJN5_9BURK|nr:hypothetical protein LMG29542_02300 [Paraburkholderia humisilvae]
MNMLRQNAPRENRRKVFRIARIFVVVTTASSLSCGLIGTQAVDNMGVHLALLFLGAGAVFGLVGSLFGALLVLWPSPKTVDATFSIMLPVMVFLALGFAAFLCGDAHMLLERKWLTALGGSLILGALIYVKARLD